MSNVMWILGILLAGYLFLATAMYFGQRSLMYLGSPERPDPATAVLPNVRVVETDTEDDLRLEHWYVPAPESAPVVVVFQGNAGHIGHRVPKFEPVAEAGYGLFLAGYRGYGGNPGRPSEDGLLADGRSALDWLEGEGIAKERIVLYGESLGTGVAVALAAEREVGGLILEAPYTSIAEVAQWHYWYLPAKQLVRDRFDSLSRIGGIGAPLMVIHGENDRTIPTHFGRAVFDAAPEPKTFHLIEEGDHLDFWDRHVIDIVLPFLDEHFRETDAERKEAGR